MSGVDSDPSGQGCVLISTRQWVLRVAAAPRLLLAREPHVMGAEKLPVNLVTHWKLVPGLFQFDRNSFAMQALSPDTATHLQPADIRLTKPDTDIPRPRIAGTASLARCLPCCHYASMGVQITIRDVSENVRDELAARAALQGKSMQEYLRAELGRLAARPSAEAWLEQVRKRKRASQTQVSSSQILQQRDADRR